MNLFHQKELNLLCDFEWVSMTSRDIEEGGEESTMKEDGEFVFYHVLTIFLLYVFYFNFRRLKVLFEPMILACLLLLNFAIRID